MRTALVLFYAAIAAVNALVVTGHWLNTAAVVMSGAVAIFWLTREEA